MRGNLDTDTNTGRTSYEDEGKDWSVDASVQNVKDCQQNPRT